MISIVVMLILAGVSLNATVGENGILTRAQNAKKTQELAQTKEELEYMFFDYNTGENDTKTISEFLNGKVASGDIDEFKVYPIDGDLKMVIKKGDNYFYVRKDGEYYSATQMETTLDDIQAGFTVVTGDSFADLDEGSMKFNLSGDQSSTLIFYDEINDSFNFDIQGGNVTIYVTQDMTLTNKNLSRSAIDIHSGATLNLYLYEDVTMTVNSGFAIDAERNQGGIGEKGKKGYAGIHVPEGATLNIFGSGKIVAIGGDASDGSDCMQGDFGGTGGGGAGAGIGGNGGDGGALCPTSTYYSFDGDPGENCGNINIYNSTTVYVYGGAGGSSGKLNEDNRKESGSGTGAGGYPGAGIGGGGAGGGAGNLTSGGGGYSGGVSEDTYSGEQSINGLSNIAGRNGDCQGGGSYFSDGTGANDANTAGKAPGQGGENKSWMTQARTGDGGVAGKGGNVKVSSNARIFAYNGNECTLDSDDENYYNKPLEIYAQNGIVSDIYFYNANKRFAEQKSKYENLLGVTINLKVYGTSGVASENICIPGSSRMESAKPVVTSYGQGIGSGAGYVELSNGTYVVDSGMN